MIGMRLRNKHIMVQQTFEVKEDLILLAIKNQIRVETEKLIKEATENIKKDMERRTPEIITALTVDIMRMTEYRVLEDRIVFTIIKK